jgi:8-oxo-dGTP pyrophosphatase MutT (NUDIX family)
VIQAAGCVVVRDGRVLLIHRERYDDWSLPKGKLEPGETFEAAALREVEEETGVRGELGAYLGETSYGEKIVRWWAMTTADDAAPSNEVDEVRWATPDEAQGLLSYPGDRDLVSRLR